MKKPIVLLSVALAVLSSCNESAPQGNSQNEQEQIAMEKQSLAVEIVADYSIVTYDRHLDLETDADFIDDETLSAMRASKMYRNKLTRQTKSGSDGDTLSMSEQIPFCADISEQTSIYQDGSCEYVQITDLDPETNPLLALHETELDLSNCVAKVEVKDGIATTYNNRGDVLSRKEIHMPDYSEYIEELERAQSESSAETKSGAKRDIDWLRARMESQCQTKAGAGQSYRIYETNGGKVVLEQCIGGTKADEGTTVRTILSSDISKNYGYDRLEGGKLKVRCRHSFDRVSGATKSSNIPIKDISEDNPSNTVVEELTSLSDGTPMLRVTEKDYSRNTVKYNIK